MRKTPTNKPDTNKVGRPTLPKGKALGSIVPIRFAESEKALFEALAQREGLSLSQWIRKTLNESID